jgi:hypothetical protein
MYVQETPEYFRLKHFLDFASHHSIKEMQPVAKNCPGKRFWLGQRQFANP